MERTVEEPDSLVLFKNSLQAAVKEVQVDVGAFKKQMEQKMEELSVSSRPFSAAIGRLQEENLQLRAKLEALSCLVEGLTRAKVDHASTGGNRRNVENGQAQGQEVVQRVGPKASPSTFTEAAESGGGSSPPAGPEPSSSPAPPPWRTRRQAEANVSILLDPLNRHSSSWKQPHDDTAAIDKGLLKNHLISIQSDQRSSL